MLHRHRLRSRVVLGLTVAIATVAGCHTPSAMLSVTRSGPGAPAATGAVQADLSALFARMKGDRRVQGLGFSGAVTQVRLSVRGPGLSEQQSALVAYTPGSLPAPITLTVSAGPSRIFLLEALDNQQRVLASIASLADVAVGVTHQLAFDGDTDVAANVLHDLLDPDGGGTAHAAFAGFGVAGRLITLVNRITGLNNVSNTFLRLNPLAVDQRFLLSQLRQFGLAYTNTTSFPTQLKEEAWGKLVVQPTLVDGHTPYTGGVTVTVFDPVSPVDMTPAVNAAGEIVLNHLPMGHWWMKLEANNADGIPIWQEVDVQPDSFRRLTAFPEARPAEALGINGMAPAIASNAMAHQELFVWSDNGQILAQRFDSFGHQPLGDVITLASAGGKEPMVVYSSRRDEYLVVWCDTTNHVLAQRVKSSDGTLMGTGLIDGDIVTGRPTVACRTKTVGEDYLLAWTDGAGINLKKLTNNDTPAGSGLDVAVLPSVTGIAVGVAPSHVSIAYNAGPDKYLLAWDQLNGINGRDIYSTAINGATAALGVRFVFSGLIAMNDQVKPVVVALGPDPVVPSNVVPEFLVIWEEHDGTGANYNQSKITARGFRATTDSYVQPSTLVLSSFGKNTHVSAAYLPLTGGSGSNTKHVLVSWEEPFSQEIHARRVDVVANPKLDFRGEMVLNRGNGFIPGQFPAVSANPGPGEFSVVWFDGASDFLSALIP